MANFFVDKSEINGDLARISGAEAEHMLRVLRMKAGDALTLCDGEGFFYDAVLTNAADGIAEAKIEKRYPAPTEPKVKITLYQGIPKNPKLEFIVQKAVEIGAAKIVPVKTARIVAKLENKAKLARLQKIALEAAKQSRRGIVPVVGEPLSFEKAAEEASRADIALIPYEEERSTSLNEALAGKDALSVSIMIGPEGGFDETEIALAKEFGIAPVTLGPRILRTETAGLVTSALVLYELGEMK